MQFHISADYVALVFDCVLETTKGFCSSRRKSPQEKSALDTKSAPDVQIDRIIVSLGMMACQRLGMPQSAIKCQTDALLSMQYAIKHVYSISETEYSSTISEPRFGTGQGSGASFAIWLGLVTVLLNAFNRITKEYEIQGLEFHDPWKEILTNWHIGAFVDDTNQVVMDPSHSLTQNKLIEKLRIAGQLLENLLHISGGALNLSKCSWSLQFWE